MKKNRSVLNVCTVVMIVLGVLSNYFDLLRYVFVGMVLLIQWYLFHHADVFSNYEKGSPKWKTYRYLSAFSMLIVVVVYCYSYFITPTSMNEDQNSYLFLILLVGVLGNLSPKIGYNRTLGLRLPWTLQNEHTWRYAHRMVGYCTIPSLIVMMVGYFLDSKECMAMGVLLWCFTPGLLSYRFDQRRKNNEKQAL